MSAESAVAEASDTQSAAQSSEEAQHRGCQKEWCPLATKMQLMSKGGPRATCLQFSAQVVTICITSGSSGKK